LKNEFSQACSGLDNIVFPVYYPELSSKRTITMDWLEGMHLKEYLQTNPSQEERNRIGQALWDFYNFQQHELRAVHADPHPGNFLITPEGKLGIIDFGCIKVLPNDFYYPFFSLTQNDVFEDREKTLQAFRDLEMIQAKDNPDQVEFYFEMYKQMISLFAKPYSTNTFDFSEKEFFENLYRYGEMISKMPEFKQARGVKHFIYVNRTNFGLYNILHDLNATVKTDTYRFDGNALAV
jgi:predicted unusual protein kinase regulating ubiquinone biosynthesis (AarF/ABC1/UbiB family)